MSQIYCNNTLINTYSIVNKKVHTIPLILRSLTFGNKHQDYWTTQLTWLGHRRVRDTCSNSLSRLPTTKSWPQTSVFLCLNLLPTSPTHKPPHKKIYLTRNRNIPTPKISIFLAKWSMLLTECSPVCLSFLADMYKHAYLRCVNDLIQIMQLK